MMRRPASILAFAAILAVGADAAPQRRQPAPPVVERKTVRQELPVTLRVGVSAGGLVTIRTIPIEEYVAGVLVGEAARESAPAALDALAIAIRTYALRNLNRAQLL